MTEEIIPEALSMQAGISREARGVRFCHFSSAGCALRYAVCDPGRCALNNLATLGHHDPKDTP